MKARKWQQGPDLIPAVVSGIITGSLIVALATVFAVAAERSSVHLSGATFTKVVPANEDPTPWVAEGPDGLDPLGIKGIVSSEVVGLDAIGACDDSACYSTCVRSLVSPFCTVTNASCVPGESACYCTYFCARDGNGVQWTPTKEMTANDSIPE